MTVLALIISLIADRLFADIEAQRRFDWFDQLGRRIRALAGAIAGETGWVAIALTLLLPLLLLDWVVGLFDNVLFNLPALALAVAALLYSLGPRDLDRQVERLLDACSRPGRDGLDDAADDILANQPRLDGRPLAWQLVDAVLAEANRRLFAPIFWFLVFGPVGAIGYRLSEQLLVQARGSDDASLARRAQTLLAVIDWIPARLTAAGYAMTGHFERALAAWNDSEDPWNPEPDSPSQPMLAAVGRAAVDLPEREEAEPGEAQIAMSLVWRTLILWMAVIGLVAVIGWLS